MAEVHFRSNACQCCAGDPSDCGCTFPCNQDVERLEKQVQRLKRKIQNLREVKS